MFAIDFTDCIVYKVNNSFDYRHYEKVNTIKEARVMLQEYWKGVEIQAKNNIKKCKNINPV